ncbi:hypothetical protein CKO42_24165 [Lamprobacter modestohalophilus]|uniref:DUF4007 domain-containing protein n=1 Tax=Lamprobacter modestohalophilus TaxID=1064514 RepID=A0A9X1B6C1_9GAMM|nr:DUF4007 family protein [Lamprobacter modestohalophilus]MBK1621450.1 hypothetical protein [Lamprobacter modestohalophilus]
MKLNPEKSTFGRHETFPLPFGWLPKSLLALGDSPALLEHPENAIRRHGVGRNMVNATHYWLRVCGLIDFSICQKVVQNAFTSVENPVLHRGLGDCLEGAKDTAFPRDGHRPRAGVQRCRVRHRRWPFGSAEPALR